MSICPKNKSSKGRRDKRRAKKSKLENVCSDLSKVQQVRRINDATPCMQELRIL